MATEIISQLNGGVALTTPAAGDLIPITDVSDNTEAASGTTKPIAFSDFAAGVIAVADAVVYKGVIDCSANPNYPAADAGHLYIVSVAGKIGGASGATVEAGDALICKTDGTSSGDQAGVGANWDVIQFNITFTPENVANKDTDGTLAANSDTKYASQKAVKTYVDAAISGGGPPTGSAGGDLTGTYPNPRVAQVNDANGNELLKFGTTASAVNEVTITNKATGNAPTVEATGGDTDIDLNLVSKGAGVVKANGSALAFKNASVNAQTGTSYTLLASDNGGIVTCDNGSAITVTVPSGLGAGFNCLVIQIGAGQVTFSPSSTTVHHRQSHTKIAGQYGIATLAAYVSNVFALGGDTAT